MEVEIRGGGDFRDVAAQLHQLSRDMLRHVARELEQAAKPITGEIRHNTTRLPRRGGLAAKVAADVFTARGDVSGSSVRVTLAAHGGLNLERINAGTILHPVFGSGSWVAQQVRPGYATDTFDKAQPRLIEAVHRGLAEAAGQL